MSRSDVDRRPVIDGSPDLLDRGITHRDATLGPILVEAARISMTIPGRQAVYEDISAWIGMSLRCARPVLRTRIGNVQRKVIGRPSPSSVDAIEALGRAAVPALALRPDRHTADRDGISLQHDAATQELEQAFTLENHNTIGLAERRLLCFGGSAASAHEVHATCQDQHPSHEAKWPRRGPVAQQSRFFGMKTAGRNTDVMPGFPVAHRQSLSPGR